MKNSILIRGIKVIENLAFIGPQSIEKISVGTKISMSATYRILCILEDLQYVSRQRSGVEDIWKLELKFLNISQSILSRLEFRNEIRDILIKLSEETNEIIQLGILRNNKVLFLDVIKKPNSLVNVADIGDEININLSASGMVLAA